MENWTQLGVAGIALGIVFFIVKYFVDAQKENRNDNRELTEKFIKIAERTLDIQSKSTQATDKLTEMIYQVIKK